MAAEALATTIPVKKVASGVPAPKQIEGIRVWDTNYLRDVLSDLPEQPLSPPRRPLDSTRPQQIQKPPWGIPIEQMKPRKPKNVVASRQRLEQHWMLTQQLEKERTKRIQQRVTETKEREDQNFSDTMTALSGENDLVTSIRNTVDEQAQEDMRRKEAVYRTWCRKVFDPIQAQISNAVHSQPVSAIEARRRQAFDEYLSITNRKKEGLFRDIVIKDLYDPFKHQANPLTYDGSAVDAHDPTLPADGPSPPARLRSGLDVRFWDKLECTPYGHYRQDAPPQPRAQAKHTQTSCKFDHYNVETKSGPAFEEYFQGGKKVFEDRRKGIESQHTLSPLKERRHVRPVDAYMHSRQVLNERREQFPRP